VKWAAESERVKRPPRLKTTRAASKRERRREGETTHGMLEKGK